MQESFTKRKSERVYDYNHNIYKDRNFVKVVYTYCLLFEVFSLFFSLG